jgi:hypothetical protein
VAAEGQEAGLVALDERLEGSLVPLTGEGYEPFVALEPEQGRAPANGGKRSTVL